MKTKRENIEYSFDELIKALDISIDDLDNVEVLCACSACCAWQVRN